MFLQAVLFTPYLAIVASVVLSVAVAVICYTQPSHAGASAGFDGYASRAPGRADRTRVRTPAKPTGRQPATCLADARLSR